MTAVNCGSLQFLRNWYILFQIVKFMCAEIVAFPNYTFDVCMVFSGILCFIPQTYNLCLFSLFYVSLVRGLSILLTFSKNKLFVFIYFLYCFSVFNIIDFYFHLYNVLISACFGLFCAFFKASWGWELRFFSLFSCMHLLL